MSIALEIIAFAILVVLVIFQTVRTQLMGENIRYLHYVLGYYRIRYGSVTMDDVMNKVGITPEKLKQYEEETDGS